MIPAPSRDGATAGGDDVDFLQRCARELRRYETVGDEARLFKIAIDARTALAAKDAEIARLEAEASEARMRWNEQHNLAVDWKNKCALAEYRHAEAERQACDMASDLGTRIEAASARANRVEAELAEMRERVECPINGTPLFCSAGTCLECTIARAVDQALAPSPAQQDAAADGMPARHDMREER